MTCAEPTLFLGIRERGVAGAAERDEQRDERDDEWPARAGGR